MSETSPEATDRRRQLEGAIATWSHEDTNGSVLTDLVRRIRLLENLERYDRATRAAQQALHEGANEVRLSLPGTVWQRRRDEWYRMDGWRAGPKITWSPTLGSPE
jgi:hypothetical protein